MSFRLPETKSGNRRECIQYTYRARVFLMYRCCAVILSLTSRTDVPHHAWLKNHGAHCLCLSQTFTHHHTVSYVTPHLKTPSTGIPSSHVSPSLSEHIPCGDLRHQLKRKKWNAPGEDKGVQVFHKPWCCRELGNLVETVQ